MNLCHHLEDFKVKAKWCFFATSHGKSPCDGIGGTLKRLAARASLQRAKTGQILTALEFFKFCQNEVPGISCMFLQSLEIQAIRLKMQERYSTAKTIPGTRSYHEFVPLNNTEIGLRRISEQEHFDSIFSFINTIKKTKINQEAEIQVGQFIACAYDSNSWIGTIIEIDNDHKDVLVKFMHPSFPALSFFWPERDDICYVPESNVLAIITPPSTSSGRQYVLKEVGSHTVTEEWQLFQH
jgi:hypothetical protein